MNDSSCTVHTIAKQSVKTIASKARAGIPHYKTIRGGSYRDEHGQVYAHPYMELLNELITETKEQVAAAEVDMENEQADIDGYEQLSEKVTERYNKVATWADLFIHSTIEAKKMIVAQFISQVRVGKDYHMEIDLKANYEMFGEMLQEDQEVEKSA